MLLRIAIFQLLLRNFCRCWSELHLHWQKLLTTKICVSCCWQTHIYIIVKQLLFFIFSLKNFSSLLSRSWGCNHGKFSRLHFLFGSRITFHSVVQTLVVFFRLIEINLVLWNLVNK